MSLRPDPRSPWGRKLWLPIAEFDARMDSVRARAGAVFEVGRGVDVDLVLMKLFNVDPDFVDLPPECAGRTTFHRDGSYSVEISRALADEAQHSNIARRRLRSTLAHECAHIVFHGELHPVGDTLFDDLDPKPVAVMCRSQHIRTAGGTADWWEYQANRGMAALLLPRDLLKEHLACVVQRRGFADLDAAFDAHAAERVIRDLCDVFDVSMEMTVYRLQEIGYIAKDADQGGLAFREG